MQGVVVVSLARLYQGHEHRIIAERTGHRSDQALTMSCLCFVEVLVQKLWQMYVSTWFKEDYGDALDVRGVIGIGGSGD